MGLNEVDIRRIVWTFAQGFIGALVVLGAGVAQAPDFQTAKAVGIAALVGAFAAGLSAVKNLLLNDGSSLK